MLRLTSLPYAFFCCAISSMIAPTISVAIEPKDVVATLEHDHVPCHISFLSKQRQIVTFSNGYLYYWDAKSFKKTDTKQVEKDFHVA